MYKRECFAFYSNITMGDVCLRWGQQKESLSLGMYALLQAEECVDVTLACQGEFIKAHKSVLSICSEYFKAVFLVCMYGRIWISFSK